MRMIESTIPLTAGRRQASRTQSRDCDASVLARFGKDDEFVLKLAAGEEDRLKCWREVYKQYAVHGYVEPGELECRYSLHDALPDTGTFLIEKSGTMVGTITVYPDSPVGLPADEIYGDELGQLREAGCKIAEIGRLAIAPEFANDRDVLMQTVEIPCLYARSVLGATHVVITVNPKHESFYRRMMLFDLMGEEKDLDSVCGAPAVLLRMDLDWQRKVIDWAKEEGPVPERANKCGRRVYRNFSTKEDEEAMAVRIQCGQRPLSGDFVERYFVCEKPLISQLSSSPRRFFEKCYPGSRFWQQTLGNRAVTGSGMEEPEFRLLATAG